MYDNKDKDKEVMNIINKITVVLFCVTLFGCNDNDNTTAIEPTPIQEEFTIQPIDLGGPSDTWISPIEQEITLPTEWFTPEQPIVTPDPVPVFTTIGINVTSQQPFSGVTTSTPTYESYLITPWVVRHFSDLTEFNLDIEYKYHSTVQIKFNDGCANYFISTGTFGEVSDTCNGSGGAGITFDDFRNAYYMYELVGDLMVRLPAMGGVTVSLSCN